MLQLLTFTTLYPNARQPRLGLFVEQRLSRLVATGRARAHVLAPVPWFPFRSGLHGRYSVYSDVPRSETRQGIEIEHPRYPVLPKVGMSIAPFLMARAVEPAVRGYLARGYDFDAIDAHYFYPDGVAATMIARRLGKPVVVTARGSDVNLLPEYRLPRRQILWAARHCTEIITVCEALKMRLVELGADASRITVLRNGVDLERFRPVEPEQARQSLGVLDPMLLSVGHLIEGKGHHIAIEALRLLPQVRLWIVGEGAMEAELRRLASRSAVAERVRFVGPVAPADLPAYYSAAEALVLPSRREGMANVLLESMACGTPVITTAVGGTPEIVSCPEAGVLMHARTPEALAEAYRRLHRAPPRRDATRRHAETFDWDATTEGQLAVFGRVRGAGAS